jgi:hypothetical protein
MEWEITRILWTATMVPVFFVFIVALGVAVHCSQKKMRPMAAWLLALAWAGIAFSYFVTILGHLFLIRTFGMGFARALTIGTEVLMLACGAVMVAAIASFKPLEPGEAQGKEASHAL